jgi:hypothetical protein
MPMIFPLIASGCFDPEATKIMGEVFEEMVTSLDRFGRPRIIQEAVARHIIDAMRHGERDLSAGARGHGVEARYRRREPRGRQPPILKI